MNRCRASSNKLRVRDSICARFHLIRWRFMDAEQVRREQAAFHEPPLGLVGTRSAASVTFPGRVRLPETVTGETRTRGDLPLNGLGLALVSREIVGRGGTRPYPVHGPHAPAPREAAPRESLSPSGHRFA